MSGTVVQVTDATFDATVVKASGPALVSFLAEWSAPSKQAQQVLAQIAAEFGGRLTVANHDIDNGPATPPKYNVNAVPTHLLFKNGKVVATRVGPFSKGQLTEWLNSSI
ncbi:thioredoxin domain-containing protein [Kitasatospora sp. NPDC057965]|uniref:thioredoxin domain-containing protein n=1 Tax=Kitasatospora sp. NPDC057965 TaxID=3346291 RepID=UPI0036DBEFEC